jgi:glycosyltransferase involved in cell wall biosynthesis
VVRRPVERSRLVAARYRHGHRLHVPDTLGVLPQDLKSLRVRLEAEDPGVRISAGETKGSDTDMAPQIEDHPRVSGTRGSPVLVLEQYLLHDPEIVGIGHRQVPPGPAPGHRQRERAASRPPRALPCPKEPSDEVDVHRAAPGGAVARQRGRKPVHPGQPRRTPPQPQPAPYAWYVRPRICLFDWRSLGHNAHYQRLFAEALAPHADVVAAAPDRSVPMMEETGVTVYPLGVMWPGLVDDRGGIDTHPDAYPKQQVAEAELDLIERVIEDTGPDHLLHLCPDTTLRWLVRRPPMKTRLSLMFHTNRAHYPSAFGSALGAKEWARAQFQDMLIRRFRRREDAHTVLSTDSFAVDRWRRRRGAPAHWAPQPPVPQLADTPHERDGCAVIGFMNRRKGLDRLAAAVALEPTDLCVSLAGQTPREYADEVNVSVEEMRGSGARVHSNTNGVSTEELLGTVAGARCAVMPYPRTFGVSRTLVETASLGTPVVTGDFGWIGHQVRTRGLGRALDTTDARALRAAILELTEDPEAWRAYGDRLAEFTADMTRGFQETIAGIFSVRAGTQATIPR